MLFKDINPFVRYARYMCSENGVRYNFSVSCDARFFYAQKGVSHIVADGVRYEMYPGSVLIINSGVEYKVELACDDVQYIVLNFDYTRKFEDFKAPIPPSQPHLFDKSQMLESEEFSDVRELNRTLYITSIPEIEKRLKSLVTEYTVKLIYHETKTSSLLAECLAECVRNHQVGFVLKEKNASMEIIEYIHNNITENITNIYIGKLFGYHPNYISSVIKQSTGMPLHKYLIKARLMRAVDLLENSQYSIGEIATMCGFCDIGYFSSYFKKNFGTSPSEYRA